MSDDTTTTRLRDYQEKGLAQVAALQSSGTRRVLAVAPTGAGKGWMIAHQAAAAAKAGRKVLVLAHRREIVLDLRKRVADLYHRVGAVLPGETIDVGARVQIASTHTLLASEALPDADELIVDESHHYLADEYRVLLARVGDVPLTGYTATPQRADGRAMGDAFDEIVRVVTYRELLQRGQIVPCDVLRPSVHTGMDLAQDPVDAYMAHAAKRQGAFMFMRDVDTANRSVYGLRSRGVAAAVIHHETSDANRKRHLDDLRSGDLRVIVNAYTMTEGVDAPNVDTVILARNCEHAGAYVQMTGRALRAYHGKSRALLVDLHGVSHLHGMPTDDRPVSLEGRGISGPRDAPTTHAHARDPLVLEIEMESVTAPDAMQPTPIDVKRLDIIRPDDMEPVPPKMAYWSTLKSAVRRGEISIGEARAAYLAQHGRSARTR